MGDRYASLLAWLHEELADRHLEVSPASSDASFRRYWRIACASRIDTLIVMDAPPDKEDCRPYVNIAERLRNAGVNAPEVLAQNLELGFLLLTDFGNDIYLQALVPDAADSLYREAMHALITIQSRGEQSGLPPYDRRLLLGEMSLFTQWLTDKELQLDAAVVDHSRLQVVFDWLADNALQQPRTFVHRDYHSRNLMRTRLNSPGILDFQDAVIGPITYDLASLLKDCYVQWPAARIQSWALAYFDLALKADLLADVTPETFLRWFDLMGVQRHLKASGIFARLWHRDGKPGYLADIPRTLSYITAIAPKYRELSHLDDLIRRHILPRLRSVAPK